MIEGSVGIIWKIWNNLPYFLGKEKATYEGIGELNFNLNMIN